MGKLVGNARRAVERLFLALATKPPWGGVNIRIIFGLSHPSRSQIIGFRVPIEGTQNLRKVGAIAEKLSADGAEVSLVASGNDVHCLVVKYEVMFGQANCIALSLQYAESLRRLVSTIFECESAVTPVRSRWVANQQLN